MSAPEGFPVRRLGALALAAGVTLAVWLANCGGAGSVEPAALTGQPAWSAQLHLHGSFSEGFGSMDSHAYQAADLGVDVLWWSDHDFRIGCYRLVSSFGFEGQVEPINLGEDWRRRREGEFSSVKTLAPSSLSRAEGRFEFAGEAFEGERCLRVSSSSERQRFRMYLLEWSAQRDLHRRPLATDVTLDLVVRPELTSADARPVVHVMLSEQAPHGDNPFDQYALHYYLDNDAEPELDGTTFRIPLAYEPGVWNELSLPVTRDAIRGFPFLQGEDNVLGSVNVGVESRSGATAAASFDRLRVRSKVTGADAFRAQRRLLDELETRYPDLHQLQGVEVSYEAQHLNEFSLGTELLDYEELLRDSGLEDERGRFDEDRLREYVSLRAVESAHARGGLISYNHMCGTGEEGWTPRRTREENLERVLANGTFGADLLEVGYRDRGGHGLDHHLWIWDRLSEVGLRLVGTGVSDYHGGQGADAWRTMENNFVSWIYADAPEKRELIEGLRAGRVFFGDIVLFDGRVDCVTARGFRMGQVVLTDREEARVTFALEGLPAGASMLVTEAGERTTRRESRGGLDRWTQAIRLDPQADGFVRVEAHGADGRALVCGNPVWFVRALGPEGVSGARAGLDVAGVRGHSLERVTLRAARVTGATLALELTAENGSLALELDPGLNAASVNLIGIEGRVSPAGERLLFTGLSGTGAVELRLE